MREISFFYVCQKIAEYGRERNDLIISQSEIGAKVQEAENKIVGFGGLREKRG